MKHIFSLREGLRPLLPAAPSPLWKSRFPSPSLNLDAHLNASIPQKLSRGSDFYLHSDHASDFCFFSVALNPQFSLVVSDLCGWTREVVCQTLILPDTLSMNSCVAWLLSSGLAGRCLRGVGVNLTPGPTPNEREWVSGLHSSLVMSAGVIRLCVCCFACIHSWTWPARIRFGSSLNSLTGL